MYQHNWNKDTPEEIGITSHCQPQVYMAPDKADSNLEQKDESKEKLTTIVTLVNGTINLIYKLRHERGMQPLIYHIWHPS